MNMRETIEDKLNEIEKRENVSILFCVESGSRAWGFASPDSDYDVRFVYVHPKDWYLSLDEKRDVVEWQLDETLDINGWDLQKTLRLLHNSNPTVFEWNNSSIIYRKTPEWEKVSRLLPKYFSIKTMMHHYLGTATGNYREYLKGETVRLKKYFYVLRPILCCEWLMDRGCPPPMLFSELKDAYLPDYLEDDVNELLEIKIHAPEITEGKRIDSINLYLDREIEKFKGISSGLDKKRSVDWSDLNHVFMDIVRCKI